METSSIAQLAELARLYGVETTYYDLDGQLQKASPDVLLAVLGALGAPLATVNDVPLAIQEHQQALWRRPVEPVIVAWDGEARLEVRLPADNADRLLTGHLRLENGEELGWSWGDLPVLKAVEIEGARYVVKQISIPRLPHGYHRFTLEIPGGDAESLIIAAPLKACIPEKLKGRGWGVFLPLYALHHKKSWGSGDFSGMERLMAWAAGMGANVVSTLPLLATFLDKPLDPSPYSPVSRRLWNEFYLDITKVPELPRCPSAQALLASLQGELENLRLASCVDYRRQMALKRRVLEELLLCCWDSPERLEGLRRFAEDNKLVEDYARFRAVSERQNLPWPQWPQPLRDGVLKEGDYDEATRRYHLYVQWLAGEQLQSLSRQSRDLGVKLYLDLPLGVHADGYDVWRERNIFVREASGGAPSDSFFIKGQDWGFPPLHPEKIRTQGYQYVIDCLQHLLRYAGILRIDHVMQFHRLFWVPKGMEAKQGVYVNYHSDEFYAILALESHRNKALIVGEDLGTVPPETRSAMSRHDLQRMYVLQYAIAPDPRKALAAVPENMVASLNTHDMPTFTAFWQGLDILDRQGLGLLDEAGLKRETERRQSLKKALVSFLAQEGWTEELSDDPQSVLRAALRFLSASQARTILINLEDLWLETQPQNTPGTVRERRNWCRKARYSFDEFSQMPQVLDALREVDRFRKGGDTRSHVQDTGPASTL